MFSENNLICNFASLCLDIYIYYKSRHLILLHLYYKSLQI